MMNNTNKPSAEDDNSRSRVRFRPIRKAKSFLRPLGRSWKVLLLVCLGVLVVVAAVIIIIKITTPASLEDEMNRLAHDYYIEKIESSSKRSTSYTLVLKNMQQIGYDISPFEDSGCSLDSYVIIYPNNTTMAEPYRTEVKLIDCSI